MLESAASESSWLHFPMGPNVRRFLGVKESQYKGKTQPRPDGEVANAFTTRLREALEQNKFDDVEQLLDFIEELVTMGIGDLVLLAAQENTNLNPQDHVRGQLAIGAAAMMDDKLDLATKMFRDAQARAPEEISIYVNMSQIFFHQQQDDAALEWAEAGLIVEPNNRRIWEIIATCMTDADASSAAQKIKALADKYNAWAGASIAAMCEDPNDPHLRAQRLEDLYRNGAADPQFLIELTGALGAAQQFAKIPPIVWRAEQQSSTKLPWQLYAHAAQAHLAQNKYTEFEELLTKAERNGDMPTEALQELKTLADEVRQEQQSSNAPNSTLH